MPGSFKVKRVGGTIFVCAPSQFHSNIEWGCSCDYCTAHPNETPQWDTFALYAEKPKDWRSDTAHLVHYPELKNE